MAYNGLRAWFVAELPAEFSPLAQNENRKNRRSVTTKTAMNFARGYMQLQRYFFTKIILEDTLLVEILII